MSNANTSSPTPSLNIDDPEFDDLVGAAENHVELNVVIHCEPRHEFQVTMQDVVPSTAGSVILTVLDMDEMQAHNLIRRVILDDKGFPVEPKWYLHGNRGALTPVTLTVLPPLLEG
jgi:hypothetical protein